MLWFPKTVRLSSTCQILVIDSIRFYYNIQT